jgi:hypothetical protein
MPFIENERYECQNGMVLQREQGTTPEGNPIGGRWVLRSADGTWMDCDQYRYDLAQRNALILTTV